MCLDACTNCPDGESCCTYNSVVCDYDYVATCTAFSSISGVDEGCCNSGDCTLTTGSGIAQNFGGT